MAEWRTAGSHTIQVAHNKNGHGHSHGHHGHSHAALPIRETLPFSRLIHEFKQVLRNPSSSRISVLLGIHIFSVILITFWCKATDSLALTTFNYLTWFHILNLLTCYLTMWIQMKSQRSHQKKSSSNLLTSNFNLGYGRFEVLAVFSASVLSQLAAMFALKESVERILEPPDIHTGRLILGGLVCFATNMLNVYLAPSTALLHVIGVSQSSWLQEHTVDLAHSICSAIPPLSRFLLPRINPLSLLTFIGLVLIFLLDLVIEINNVHSTDCVMSIILALLLFGTMHPFTIYTGKILLQTTPPHIVPQLERCLREALTIDGVLEFTSEHFWTISFGKLAGSLTVRIRRDADEQLVLAHLTNSLSNLVWPLTIQITKDDHFITKMQNSNKDLLASVRHQSSIQRQSNSPGMSPVNGQYRSLPEKHSNNLTNLNSPINMQLESNTSMNNSSSKVLTSTPKGSEEVKSYQDHEHSKFS